MKPFILPWLILFLLFFRYLLTIFSWEQPLNLNQLQVSLLIWSMVYAKLYLELMDSFLVDIQRHRSHTCFPSDRSGIATTFMIFDITYSQRSWSQTWKSSQTHCYNPFIETVFTWIKLCRYTKDSWWCDHRCSFELEPSRIVQAQKKGAKWLDQE